MRHTTTTTRAKRVRRTLAGGFTAATLVGASLLVAMLPASALDGGITVSSSFADGAVLPVEITCDGAGTSPQLSWSAGPAGTQSYAIIMHDEFGANQQYDMTDFLHWSVWNIPVGTTSIAAGTNGGGTEGLNDFFQPGYGPACPPAGDAPHDYFVTVYALNTTLVLPPNAMGFQVSLAMTGTILDQGDIMGLFRVPTVEFAAATGSAAEGAGGSLPSLLVNGTLAASVTVTVDVTGGSATAGTDFTAPTIVTIPAGTYDGTAATAVAIPGFAVTDDVAVEGDETITFGLTSADTTALVVGDADGDATTRSALTFTITDDDTAPAAPTVEFAAATASAAEGAGGSLPGLLVNGTLAVDVVVTVNVTGGTATAGSDFGFATPTTVTIPAGTHTGANFPIPGFTVVDDTGVEPSETITFGLSSANPTALPLGNTQVLTFTITDNDVPPVTGGTGGTGGGAGLAETGNDVSGSALTAMLLLVAGGVAAAIGAIRRKPQAARGH